MQVLRQFLKAIIVCFIISNYLLSSLVARLVIPGRLNRRRFFINNVHRFCRVILHVIGVELLLEHAERWSRESTHMVLSNHLSYLDVLIIAAIHPVCFVTSVEVKNMPFLGIMAEFGGSIFVERRSRHNLKGEVGEITEALRNDYSVVVFPEATSTNGSSVLPFKRSLLNAAVESKRSVLPITVNYEALDDEAVTAKNRDALCWYGDMSFAPHFYGLMRFKKIKIRVTLLEEILITEGTTRDTLIDAAYTAINSKFLPFVQGA